MKTSRTQQRDRGALVRAFSADQILRTLVLALVDLMSNQAHNELMDDLKASDQ